jgi:hypothetical protein
MVDGKERTISSQFYSKIPEIIILEKEASRDLEGFELCGIFTDGQDEWLNGRSGLPEGSNIKTYK